MDESLRMAIDGVRMACEDVLERGCDPITALSLARTLKEAGERLNSAARTAARVQALRDAVRR